jgi:phosphoglucosamine mutase
MKYFGTDGIRDLANKGLGPEFVLQVGKSIGAYLKESYPQEDVHVCIGRDPRPSGVRIEQNLVEGLQSVGVHCHIFGILPTPAVSRLCKNKHYHMGIVISASHNPAPYNGIKLFQRNGEKASEEAEERIEVLLDCPWLIQETPGLPGSYIEEPRAIHEYVSDIVAQYSFLPLSSINILVDCANGATSFTTPKVFSKLGARVTAISTQTDGDSINHQCGSLHPEAIQQYLQSTQTTFDFIFSHDGDGDRVLAFTPDGKMVNGDQMLTTVALAREQLHTLSKKTVVGTVMTNEGIIEFLKNRNIEFYRSNVGDKYVYRDMIRLSAQIGGEQSGHLLFLDKSPTGDGLVSALEYIHAITTLSKPVQDSIHHIPLYVQNLTNLRVHDKNRILSSSQFCETMEQIQAQNPDARMIVRPSGTEPLFRVLVETPTQEKTTQLTQQIVRFIETMED